MNELQSVEFDMLKEFVRVCDELGLKYYLVCGSALGAVKYNGFIPWDDDLDVALPREDYRIFCSMAQSMLPDHLFVQNYLTDDGFPLIFTKIRNSNTTFVEKSYSKLDINHGIYIDVFPLDGYPASEKEATALEKEKRRYAISRLCCLNVPLTWKTRLIVFAERLLRMHKKPKRFVKRLEDRISQYSVNDSKLWCNHGNWQGKLEYAPRDQYGEGAWATFEGLKVRVPKRYDEYLTQKYGDWRADLPEEEKQGHHYHTVCDTERSYKDYCSKPSK